MIMATENNAKDNTIVEENAGETKPELTGKEKAGRVVTLVLRIFTWMVVAFAAFIMIFTIFSRAVYDKKDGTDIFGLRFLSVLSDSMSKSEKNKDDKVHFNTNDIIIVKEMKDATKDGKEYKVGDIIAFNTMKEINGKKQWVTVTHKIYAVENVNGQVQYVTYGTNTGEIDKNKVLPVDIIGEYVGKIPYGNLFLTYLRSPLGYIICILIPFLLLIGYNGLNCILLFRRYKKEQTEEMNAERAKIEQERDQALAMMKELEALKSQMSGNAPPAEAPVAEPKAQVEAPVVEPVAETAEEPAENEAAKALEEEQRKAQEMQKELEALKAQLALEEEKRKTLEMQKELEALKAQLAKKDEDGQNG